VSETPPLPDRRAPTWQNKLLDAWEILQYQVFRRLPIDLGPRLAAPGIVAYIKRERPWVVERARANLQRHRPWASDAQIEAWVESFLDNIGRYVGETASVGRYWDAGRIELPDPERAKAIRKRGGVLALCLHTGNWEVMLEGLKAVGMSAACAPIEWETRGQTWIINDLRRRNGLRYLSMDHGGVRAAYKEVKEDGLLAIFVDEAREGKLMAPLFGRPPHAEGNLAVAAKLARRSGCTIVLCYVTRLPEQRFRVTFSDVIEMPKEPKGLLEDVAFLNSVIEPVILEHLEQWFWLDDSF
jgi:Kdo2-lipid IVA lauroyltransferase/acyltransferase